MAYITVDNLSLGYEKSTVTKNLNFEVNEGDYLCVVGENGAGKSTLIKTLLQLIPPVSGQILFGDGMSAKQIGYLPQQTMVQKDFPATVQEIVLSGNLSKCGWHPFYRKEDKQNAKEKMEMLGITNLRNACYRNLSGGQQQRVLLARALCSATTMLLLDEPVSGLDPKATRDLYQQIKKLNEQGVTIIMVSHDIHAAKKDASHILHIGKRQLFFGTKEDYLKSNEWKLFGSVEEEENE